MQWQCLNMFMCRGESNSHDLPRYNYHCSVMLMFLTVWFHFRHLVWVESMDWCLNKRLELEEIQSGVELGYDTCCVPKVPFSTFFNTGRFQCWTWFLTLQYFQQHCCKNREETANKINLLSWADAPWMQTYQPSILNLQNVSTIIMLQLESQNHPNDSFFLGGGIPTHRKDS